MLLDPLSYSLIVYQCFWMKKNIQSQFHVFIFFYVCTVINHFKVFTTIFTAECAVKLPALGKTYFASRWNIFDLVIVIASLVDLALENVDGLNVLRSIRLVSIGWVCFNICNILCLLSLTKFHGIYVVEKASCFK